jgi:hypothetical protein
VGTVTVGTVISAGGYLGWSAVGLLWQCAAVVVCPSAQVR